MGDLHPANDIVIAKIGIKWLPRSPVPGEDTSLDSAMHGTWALVYLRCPAPAQVSTWVMPDSMAH